MSKRPATPDHVYFPAVPMLDMAFQLLAFFILTFQAPGRESRLDLELPAAPVALPAGGSPRAERPSEPPIFDVPVSRADAVLQVEADDEGRLTSLRLGTLELTGTEQLRERLAEAMRERAARPMTLAILADDSLRYGEAARILAACDNAGVGTIRILQASPGTAEVSTDPAPGPPR